MKKNSLDISNGNNFGKLKQPDNYPKFGVAVFNPWAPLFQGNSRFQGGMSFLGDVGISFG